MTREKAERPDFPQDGSAESKDAASGWTPVQPIGLAGQLAALALYRPNFIVAGPLIAWPSGWQAKARGDGCTAMVKEVWESPTVPHPCRRNLMALI
jgi:hypothetical protein